MRFRMEILVDAVIVPPFKAGEAFGHTRDGRCVSFTGERERMVELCAQVLAHVNNGGPAPRIALGRDFHVIDSTFCPLSHTPQTMAS